MSWLQEEQQRRTENEIRPEAEARKTANSKAKETGKIKKELARCGMKKEYRFANRVKKELPRGVSIVEKLYIDNAHVPGWVSSLEKKSRTDLIRPVLRIEMNNGLKCDLMEHLSYYWEGSEWDRRAHDVVAVRIFESGGDYSSGECLTSISGRLSKKTMRAGLYDAYQRLAATHGNLETHP